MNGKKARALRKQLGMTKENHRQPEYNVINKIEKVVYFSDKLGQLTPVQTERVVIVNKSLYFYRKAKKELKKQGAKNGRKQVA